METGLETGLYRTWPKAPRIPQCNEFKEIPRMCFHVDP